MKRIVILTTLIVCQLMTASAQENKRESKEVKTIFGGGTSFGGFLEVGAKAGDINGQSGLLVGGAISAVFSSRVNIGLAGYGLATQIEADTYDEENRKLEVDMGYGGLLIEPIIGNSKMVHLTVPVLLGVGGAGLRYDRIRDFSDPDPDRERKEFWHQETDVFLVAEPGLNIELNLLRNVRLDLGATYRYVYDNNLEGLSDQELSGFTGSVGLKFGWF